VTASPINQLEIDGATFDLMEQYADLITSTDRYTSGKVVAMART
jgi:hypothetical protein